MNDLLTILHGDSRETLARVAPGTVQCCVTSPPYWGLRSYLRKDHPDKAREIGQEKTPADFVASMLAVFGGKENPVGVWRALREDGTLWLNLGDSYAANRSYQVVDNKRCDVGNDMSMKVPEGFKAKDLLGIPWRVAFALQAAGWYLRSDIIWAKPNCMPESVTDRCTRSHEYIFLLSKAPRYFYDADAIKEPMCMASEARLSQDVENQTGSTSANGGAKTNGAMKAVGRVEKQRGHSRRHNGFSDRWDQMEKEEQCSGYRNKRDVWNIAPAKYSEAHFATFPKELITPCILAGSRPGDVVLDPFGGSGTTAEVALELGRKAIVSELNDEYLPFIERRTFVTPGLALI